MHVNQLLRRQIVKTVTELRGKDGTLSVHRCMVHLHKHSKQHGHQQWLPGSCCGWTGKDLAQCHWRSQELPRSTPSQHCPPLEPGLGESHGDFSVSSSLLQPLTGFHIVLVSVDSGLPVPWPAVHQNPGCEHISMECLERRVAQWMPSTI